APPCEDHANSLAEFRGVMARLEKFTRAAIHLLWRRAQRESAFGLAVDAGWLNEADAAELGRMRWAASDPRWMPVLDSGRADWENCVGKKFPELERDEHTGDLEHAADAATILCGELSRFISHVCRAI